MPIASIATECISAIFGFAGAVYKANMPEHFGDISEPHFHARTEQGQRELQQHRKRCYHTYEPGDSQQERVRKLLEGEGILALIQKIEGMAARLRGTDYGDKLADDLIRWFYDGKRLVYPECDTGPRTIVDDAELTVWNNKTGPIIDKLRGLELQLDSVQSVARKSCHIASAAVDDDSYLSTAKLAELFEVPLNSLKSRLKRWRKKTGTGWMENPAHTSRDALYLYRVGSLRSILTALKATPKRPPKKFSTRL